MKLWLGLVHHWLVMFWGISENILFSKVGLLNTRETIRGLHLFLVYSLVTAIRVPELFSLFPRVQLLHCPRCWFTQWDLVSFRQVPSLLLSCLQASADDLSWAWHIHSGYRSTGKQAAMLSFSLRKGLSLSKGGILFPSPQLSNFF